MPGPRLPVRKIRDVLRLSAAGMSKRQVAVSLGVSATAAREGRIGEPVKEHANVDCADSVFRFAPQTTGALVFDCDPFAQPNCAIVNFNTVNRDKLVYDCGKLLFFKCPSGEFLNQVNQL